MRIAATCADGRIAPCFAGVDLVVEPEDDARGSGREVASTAGWHLAAWGHELCRRDVRALLCSGIDRFLAGILQGYGIAVVMDVTGPVDEALAHWRSGALPAVLRARRCRRRRFRGGRGR